MNKNIFLLIIIVFSLLIGRNLTFLPKINFQSDYSISQNLKKDIQAVINNPQGSYSVYFNDLNNKNLSFGINENTIYTAASVNKAPIIAALYNLAKKNRINLDEQITIQNNDIQDYGTGSIRY